MLWRSLWSGYPHSIFFKQEEKSCSKKDFKQLLLSLTHPLHRIPQKKYFRRKTEVFFLSNSQPKSEALKIPFSQFEKVLKKNTLKVAPALLPISQASRGFYSWLILVQVWPINQDKNKDIFMLPLSPGYIKISQGKSAA